MLARVIFLATFAGILARLLRQDCSKQSEQDTTYRQGKNYADVKKYLTMRH